MNFQRMLELQVKDERNAITDAEMAELERLELNWHNATLTDSHDIPVRA